MMGAMTEGLRARGKHEVRLEDDIREGSGSRFLGRAKTSAGSDHPTFGTGT